MLIIEYVDPYCVLQLEVRPSSFTKLRMLGKGDVGKVYLVREKKTEKLYAMKGAYLRFIVVQITQFNRLQ